SKFLESADVVIAGGGVMGCALAHQLAKRRVDVMLLERETLRRAGDAVGRTERAAEHVVLAAVPGAGGILVCRGLQRARFMQAPAAALLVGVREECDLGGVPFPPF